VTHKKTCRSITEEGKGREDDECSLQGGDFEPAERCVPLNLYGYHELIVTTRSAEGSEIQMEIPNNAARLQLFKKVMAFADGQSTGKWVNVQRIDKNCD